MQIGKGGRDFNTYVQNLQRATVVSAIGSQLSPASATPIAMRVMIHNPYIATIADLGICHFRTGSAV